MSSYAPSSLSQLLYDAPGQLACISKLHYHNVRFKGLLLLSEIKRGINLSRRCLASTLVQHIGLILAKLAILQNYYIGIYFLRHDALMRSKIHFVLNSTCDFLSGSTLSSIDAKHDKGYWTKRKNIGKAFNLKKGKLAHQNRQDIFRNYIPEYQRSYT